MSNELSRHFFDDFYPLTVGFDEIFRRLEEFPLTQLKGISYPPFNIRKIDDNHYVVEMAVAGFDKNDLDITMEDGNLTISGKAVSTSPERDDYVYRGIAARSFVRSFSLADSIEIKDAQILNGMLRIFLENIIPLSKQAKKIPISNGETVGETKDTRQLLNEKA